MYVSLSRLTLAIGNVSFSRLTLAFGNVSLERLTYKTGFSFENKYLL